MTQLVGASFMIATTHTSPPAAEAAVDRSVRLVNLAGEAAEDLLGRVRADMPGAIAAVERFWGPDWTRDITVIATGSQTRFEAEAGLDPGGEWADIAAVSVADDVDLARRQAVGQRIVLAPGAASMSDSALRIVLAHELFHLAARADTALDAPRWITEGVADFVARPAEPLPTGAALDTALPSDAALDVPGPGRSAGYDRAWWFARFTADTYGVDGLRRFYVRACGPGHGDLAAAVGAALGTELAELQRRWARWLTR